MTATGKISCTATYRKSAGSADAATARALATAACAIAKQTNPLVTTEIGIVESTSSQRKVLLALINQLAEHCHSNNCADEHTDDHSENSNGQTDWG